MIYPLGLVNTKQRYFFFVSSFVLLWLMLQQCSYACAYVALYVAGVTAFLCFAFCLSLLATSELRKGLGPSF